MCVCVFATGAPEAAHRCHNHSRSLLRRLAHTPCRSCQTHRRKSRSPEVFVIAPRHRIVHWANWRIWNERQDGPARAHPRRASIFTHQSSSFRRHALISLCQQRRVFACQPCLKESSTAIMVLFVRQAIFRSFAACTSSSIPVSQE